MSLEKNKKRCERTGVETTARLVRTDRGRRLEGSMEVTGYEPINR